MEHLQLLHNKLIFTNCVIGINLVTILFSLSRCIGTSPDYTLSLLIGAILSWSYAILNGLKYKKKVVSTFRINYRKRWQGSKNQNETSITYFNRIHYASYIGVLLYFVWYLLHSI